MIHYLKGDATELTGFEPKLIIHVCNNQGAWGAGFVLALSKKWKQPEYYYRRKRRYKLGDIQFVQVNDHTTVVNMIAQVLGDKNGVNLRYMALRQCLYAIRDYAINHNCTIHAPRFGAGLAGGDWKIIERMINQILSDVKVYIYDL